MADGTLPILELFSCEAIRATKLTRAQCATNWRRANLPASKARRAVGSSRAPLGHGACRGCETGRAHAAGERPDVLATQLTRHARTTSPATHDPIPTPTTIERFESMPKPQTTSTSTGYSSAPKLTADQRAAVAKRSAAGEDTKAIAAEFGITESYVRMLARQAGDPPRARPTSSPGAKAKKAPAVRRVVRTPGRTPEDVARLAELERHTDEAIARQKAKQVAKPYTVAEPVGFAHEDVIEFLAKMPPLPWPLGDAIRLLAFHAIDGDTDDVHQARERIDAHLRARGEAA